MSIAAQRSSQEHRATGRLKSPVPKGPHAQDLKQGLTGQQSDFCDLCCRSETDPKRFVVQAIGSFRISVITPPFRLTPPPKLHRISALPSIETRAHLRFGVRPLSLIPSVSQRRPWHSPGCRILNFGGPLQHRAEHGAASLLGMFQSQRRHGLGLNDNEDVAFLTRQSRNQTGKSDHLKNAVTTA